MTPKNSKKNTHNGSAKSAASKKKTGGTATPLSPKLEKLPRKGLSKEERQRRREMREMLGSEPLLGTAGKERRAGRVDLAAIAELENVRPEYHGIEELAENIKEVGLIHPLVIRRSQQPLLTPGEQTEKAKAEGIMVKRQEYVDSLDLGTSAVVEYPPELQLTSEQETLLQRHGRPYELVSGYRRKRALELLGHAQAEAKLSDYSEQEVLELMMSENIQREKLSPVAEAKAMQRLIELFDLTHKEVGQRLGVDRSHVSHRLSLLNLTPPVQQLIDDGKLTASHGEILTILPEAQQQRYAEKALTSEIGVGKLSNWVREIKEGKPNPLAQLAVEFRLEPHEVTQVDGIVLRDDLKALDYKRLLLYGAIRNFNDQQILYMIEDEHGVSYERLWDYVRELDETAVDKFLQLLAVRFAVAGHRAHSLEDTLLDDVAVGDADAGASVKPADVRKINEELQKRLAPEELKFNPDYHSKRVYPPEFAQARSGDEVAAELSVAATEDDETDKKPY